ncbi:hypothetical protein [Acetobacter conturbans]|uniref:Tetratricopeptide repeat-like domain-containing protein n=1 Tax=Acetobacter conturbans TaxID=1737472 RepID=A0ABX0JWD5_9PROT|nr:hypothetical protein [Acetobacter conturbans]
MSDEIFREVDEAVRLERLRQAARRFAGLGLGAIILVCAGIGGWEYRESQRARADTAQSATYIKALHDLGSDASVAGLSAPLNPEQQKAVAALMETGRSARPDLGALARLRVASSDASHGRLTDALAIWEGIRQDAHVAPVLRSMASLLWCEWQLDTGDIATVRSRLSLLASESKPFAALANEQLAMLDIRAGDLKSARGRLTGLAQDYNAPSGVRMRAGGLLQTLDQQG